MKKIIFAAILIFIFSMPSFAIEEIQIKKGDKLLLSDCIKIAIKNSPVIKKAEQNYNISKKNVNIAKSDYFPTLGANLGYQEMINSDRDYDDGSRKNHAPMVGVYLNQLIYNFGKTSSLIQMQKFYQIAAEYRYLDSICETINNVKLKYCEVLQAQAAVMAEKENVLISEKMLKMTKKFYDENKKSEIDYINAKVYLSAAKISLEEANNRYNQTYIDLCNAMYIGDAPKFDIQRIDTFDYYDAFFSPTFIETPKGYWHEITNRPREKDKGMGDIQTLTFSLEEACDSAFKNSPDIHAMDAVISAMEKSVINIKRQFYPSLKVRAGYDYDHEYKSSIKYKYSNNQFNVLLTLNASINGMQYKNSLDKAKLLVETAKSDEEKLHQDIYFNVKRYYYDVKSAEKQIANSKEKVLRALDNLEAIRKSYIAGTSNYLELQTARKDFNTAKIDHIMRVYYYNVSLAKLERITHRHVDEVWKFVDMKNKMEKI